MDLYLSLTVFLYNNNFYNLNNILYSIFFLDKPISAIYFMGVFITLAIYDILLSKNNFLLIKLTSYIL